MKADAQEPKLDDIQKNVLARLKRIEGQVRGIQNMVNNGKECEDILIQVRAVNSALKATTKQILKRYIKVCHTRAMQADDPEEAKAQMEKSAKLLADFLDG
jgi:DNA-binding FrmR family transcriptional regulator